MKKIDNLCSNNSLVIDTNLQLKFCTMKYLPQRNAINFYIYGKEKILNKENGFFEVIFNTNDNRIENVTRYDVRNNLGGIVLSPSDSKADYLLYSHDKLIYINPDEDRSTALRLPYNESFKKLLWLSIYENSIFSLTMDNQINRLDLNTTYGQVSLKETFTPNNIIIDMINCEFAETASALCLSFYNNQLALYDTRDRKLSFTYETPFSLKNLSTSGNHYYLSCTDLEGKNAFIYDLRYNIFIFLNFLFFF
jgi:hypothetical protein